MSKDRIGWWYRRIGDTDAPGLSVRERRDRFYLELKGDDLLTIAERDLVKEKINQWWSRVFKFDRTTESSGFADLLQDEGATECGIEIGMRAPIEEPPKVDFSSARQRWDRQAEEFEGKSKPGDWRPNGTEACFACGGGGVGEGKRVCSTCRGRGYVSHAG